MNILENIAKAYQNKEISLEEYAFNLANEYSRVCKSNYKLQERIDKAIEYIENYAQVYEANPILDEFNIQASPKELINILKGGK